MLLAVHISSYGCTWEVWRALKKLELLSAMPQATLMFLLCSPNFPRTCITRYTHAKHQPILKYKILQALHTELAVKDGGGEGMGQNDNYKWIQKALSCMQKVCLCVLKAAVLKQCSIMESALYGCKDKGEEKYRGILKEI